MGEPDFVRRLDRPFQVPIVANSYLSEREMLRLQYRFQSPHQLTTVPRRGHTFLWDPMQVVDHEYIAHIERNPRRSIG